MTLRLRMNLLPQLYSSLKVYLVKLPGILPSKGVRANEVRCQGRSGTTLPFMVLLAIYTTFATNWSCFFTCVWSGFGYRWKICRYPQLSVQGGIRKDPDLRRMEDGSWIEAMKKKKAFLDNPFRILDFISRRMHCLVVLRLVDLFYERRAVTRWLVREAAREKQPMEVKLEEQGLLDALENLVATSSTSYSQTRVRTDVAIFPGFV